MPKPLFSGKSTRKEVYIPPVIHEEMMTRKAATRVDLADQVHLALESAMAAHRAGHTIMWDKPLPLAGNDDDVNRLPMTVQTDFWASVKSVAKEQGRNLRTFVIISLLNYLETGKLPTSPAAAESPRSPQPIEGVSLSDLRRVVQEETRNEIRRATRPLPPIESAKLLSALGEWTRPQGSEYMLAGQVNAGPLRDLTDLPEAEIFSDFEILEWEAKQDMMLRITEDANDGVCLIGDDIYPNDILHFRCGLVPENGEIVLVLGYDLHGAPFGTVKHFFQASPEYVELRPSNPACDIIRVHPEDIEVRGVLFNHIRRNFRARVQMRSRLGVGIDYRQMQGVV